MTKQRLAEKSVRYLIKQHKIGKSTSNIAAELDITARYTDDFGHGSSTPKPFQKYENLDVQPRSQVILNQCQC